MRVFNATNLILTFQDRIVLPGRFRDFPGVEQQHLDAVEVAALEKGIFSMSPCPLKELHHSFPTHLPARLADVIASIS